MRVDDSVVLDNYKEISDTWRNKYNDPIQVYLAAAPGWPVAPYRPRPPPHPAAPPSPLQVPSGSTSRGGRGVPKPAHKPMHLKPFRQPTSYIRLIENPVSGGAPVVQWPPLPRRRPDALASAAIGPWPS